MSASTSPIDPSAVTFFERDSTSWVPLPTRNGSKDRDDQTAARGNGNKLQAALLASLQMKNLVVFAGSGTSLGVTGGPSMADLWTCCVKSPDDQSSVSDVATEVMNAVEYDCSAEGENIETLLSRCEAYDNLYPTTKVRDFIVAAKATILRECSGFLEDDLETRLRPHRQFLLRMSRRRARDPRLKIFTTNYDLCFETAAARQRLVIVDGFSFAEPRLFDPSYFDLDVVRRRNDGNEFGAPLEGLFKLYKIHGSVNWSRTAVGEIRVDATTNAEDAVLIYPAAGKYRQSYAQPHLEMVSRYLAALREPNTCVVVVGFGFHDHHLSEPILSAVRTNPFMRLIVVSPDAEQQAERGADFTEEAEVWGELRQLALAGEDVWLISGTFEEFAELIPDLKAMSPSERLRREIESIAAGGTGRS